MLRRLIGAHIELVTLMESDLALVEVDPTQIEQILINLVVNARDAMPEGGKLVVETANVDVGEHFAERYPEIPRGEYVTMSVGDAGVGMTKEAQVKAFEPFFTTKKGGASTKLASCLSEARPSCLSKTNRPCGIPPPRYCEGRVTT